jgi:hypothetical protein
MYLLLLNLSEHLIHLLVQMSTFHLHVSSLAFLYYNYIVIIFSGLKFLSRLLELAKQTLGRRDNRHCLNLVNLIHAFFFSRCICCVGPFHTGPVVWQMFLVNYCITGILYR